MNPQISRLGTIHHAFLAVTMIFVAGCVSTLERAVESGDYDAAKRAIEKGGNVDGNFWVTIKEPMYRAVDNGDLEMVKLLHENGAKILPDFLSEAARASALNTYSYLLANGNEIDACFDDYEYPGFWNILFVLPSSNMPPLGSAVARGNIPSIQKLIELGAQIEQRCESSSGRYRDFSAIILAAYFGDPKVIRLLIRSGASPNRFVNGMTPLSIAADEGNYEAARALLADGAFHTYSDDVKQPIEYALEWGHEDIVNLLVYAGATRPRQIRPSELFEGVVDALCSGQVIPDTLLRVFS